jgi:hypothetical protein
MIMAKKPDWMRDLDDEQVEFYRGLDPEQAVCRGKRRHLFPGIVPGRKIPVTIDLVPVGYGVVEITEHCERGCGRWIRYLTRRNGTPDYSTAHYGGGGRRYRATGLRLTVADDRAFMEHVQGETIRDAVQLAGKPVRTA